ncbi:BMP family ABC transporter substrate-binding protein [Streptomyces sp. YC504]|uniref:BMP family ABC transporter substrate-binding protein n=1 Tax=Streptomyces mesophilus TaxID=1775132 RepID=A0A6G4XID0_9ACTN|nr:BMP family ABC transporter substrate-binding protein [Streptomyces mesophilus]NGO77326.1 BMP family ABC transporter substrate-binding protein [Streptomyces mesophilus]
MRQKRRISRLSRVAVAVSALALAASACGKTSTESNTPEETKGGDKGGSSSYKGKGIGLAYDIGGQGDQSFNDAAYAGYEKAKAEFKIGGVDVEPSDGESDADKVQRLTALAKQGYNPVIGVGFVYAKAVGEVSKKFPKTTFAVIDDTTVKEPNVAGLAFSEEQGSYLAGVAAAKATKTKTVGFIGGVEIPLIKKFEAGFVQGVQDTDKSVKVKTQYLTQPPNFDGFSKPDLGREAAKGQLDAGADVIYHAAGLAGQGSIEAVAAEKKWAIGVDSDQYNQKALDKYKAYILTSMTKDVGGAVYSLTKSVIEGKPLSGEQRFDLKAGGVGLSDSNPAFKEMTDVVDAVAKAKKAIEDGTITVKSTP